MKTTPTFLRTSLCSALFTASLLQVSISYADDTEIFFGGAVAEEGVRPNVLFILDNSTSMNCLPSSTQAACAPQSGSRLALMKEAFNNIVTSSNGINIGAMALTANSGNTPQRLIAPVDYIDKDIPISDISDISYPREIAIQASSDDASQTADNVNNVTNGTTLTLGGNSSQIRAGLRFQNVPIPQGATITSARLTFVPSGPNSNSVTLKVLPQAADDAATFTAAGRLSGLTWQDLPTFPTWTPGTWTANERIDTETGADVTQQVQYVVNRSGWCGNNAMAFQLTRSGSGTLSRTVHSFDATNRTYAPTLEIEFTTTGTPGCLNPIVELPVTTGGNDAVQAGTTTSTRTPALGGNTLVFGGNTTSIGARFENVPIRQGATILDATLIATTTAGNSSGVAANIGFQANDSAPAFSSTASDLSGRTVTSTQSCTFNYLNSTPTTVFCPGLTASLQTVVNRPGWLPGNAVAALIRPTVSGATLRAYEGSASQAIKLRVKLRRADLVTRTTYRDLVNAQVQALTSGTNSNGNYQYTPIVPTLYDAASYLRNADNSPIESACQPTHVVLLSDGEPNNTNSTNYSSLSGLGGPATCTSASTTAQRCGRDIAEWMATTNQSSWIDDASNYVTTHTVGFALGASRTDTTTCNFSGTNSTAANFLCEIAAKGNGGFYSAQDAADLTDAFTEIIQNVIATDASFVSASAPVNSFNRVDNNDELYFSVFRPQETDRWPGNLKRYRLDIDGLRILDVTGSEAVDSVSGFFRTTARSWWSPVPDGNLTSVGGAASQLPAPGLRKLFTFTGSSPNNTSLSLMSTTDASLNALFGLGSTAADNTERTRIVNYLLGWDGGVPNGTPRKAIGDPLHSSPRLVTYYAGDTSAVIGTNEGMVHVVNTSTGVEQFAFMPKALLGNAPRLAANERTTTTKRPYGMDNTVTLWVNDVNNDGQILQSVNGSAQTGEFVYAYATMGRGGRNLYALDITSRSAPRLLWEIIGGTTAGFERLGQTWSTPVKTKIQIGTASDSNPPTDVLIFAGGYDPQQDNQLEDDTSYVRNNDSMGNSIYIVNARTGALIWSASSASGHTATLSNMLYSMPSPVKVIDLQRNANGALVYDSKRTADQIFVGDMGGQVWRFYINNGSSGAGLITPANGDGVFASLGGNGANARRFYHAPDVALLNNNGTLKLTVNIGSGYRGHPLHKVIRDRFYSIHTTTIVKAANEGRVTESSLADLTSDVVETSVTTKLATKSGWYLQLGTTGEKVLSTALTADGKLYFNTYEPTARSDSCQASIGINRAYSVLLSTGLPATTTVGATPSNRYAVVQTSGLLPDPTVVSIGGKNVLVRFPIVTPLPNSPDPSTYWIDVTESN